MKTILHLCASCVLLSAAHRRSDNYLLAYNVSHPDKTYGYEVYAMETDGSNKRNLTKHKDVAWTYYAHNNRLFFISDRDTCYRCYYLYEMKPDGSGVRKVSGLQLEDSWMSSRNNGKEMIVSGRIGKDTRFQLFTVDSKSGTFRQLTTDTSAMYRDPAFSPDGRQIVFAYKPKRRDRNAHEELYIMNADGSGMRQLTHYPQNDPLLKDFGYKAGAPRWHPTENFISYNSKQAGKYSLYAVTPDGKKQWKLTGNPVNEGWHDWSPDGRRLAFDSSNPEETQYHIMLMDWQSKKTVQLTDTTFHYQFAPVFVKKR